MKKNNVNFDSFGEVTKEFVKFRDELNWSKFHGPSMLATSLSVEVGELLEHFLWLSDDQIISKVNKNSDKKEAVADELVDVMYHVLVLADYFKIDLSNALNSKLQKNKKKYPVKLWKNKHKNL